jgi:DNA-binding transcriptional MerR regulator
MTEWMRTKHVAEKYKVSPSTLERWAARGMIGRKKEGGRVYFDAAAVAVVSKTKKAMHPFLHKKVEGETIYRCTRCLDWQPRENYYHQKGSGTTHGLIPRCKKCYSDIGKERRQNPKEQRARIKRSRARYKDSVRRAKASSRQRDMRESVSPTPIIEFLDKNYSRYTDEDICESAGLHHEFVRKIRYRQTLGKGVTLEKVDKLLTGLGEHGYLDELYPHKTGALRWASEYDYCQKCLRTKRPHMAAGYCHTCYPHRNDPNYVPPLDDAAWSRYHAHCVECGTTESKHAGRGMCAACYCRKRRARRKAMLVS